MNTRPVQILSALLRPWGLEARRLDDGLPVECDARDRKFLGSFKPFTMTTYPRMWALLQSVRYVHLNGVAGDLVECGVWRGGSAALMARAMDQLGDMTRRVWMYDTFSGMTEPGRIDVEAYSGRTAEELMRSTKLGDGNNVWAMATLPDVMRNLTTLGVDASRFEIVVGDVRQTLYQTAPTEIAVLRLDTDFYDSTMAELECLYPKLSVGGVLVIDDYGHWLGARCAVEDYFHLRDLSPLLVPIDETGRLCIKTG